MDFILLCIIWGIPATFFFLCIANIVRMVKAKKANIPVPKAWIIQTVVFGVIFTLIAAFYLWVMYSLSQAIAHM